MPTKYIHIRTFFAACWCLLAFASCKKNGYLTDTGIHDPVTPLSNYDYLAQNQFKQFDTLLQIVDRFPGLKDQMNKAGTFGAGLCSLEAFCEFRIFMDVGLKTGSFIGCVPYLWAGYRILF